MIISNARKTECRRLFKAARQAEIRNVTRGDFYLYGYATDDGIGRYSEPGRNWRVSLNWTF